MALDAELTGDIRRRSQGCLVGQLVGDALGSMVEFMAAREIARLHPGGLRTIGPSSVHHTIAGQPTDDSELALALARSLVIRRGFDGAIRVRENAPGPRGAREPGDPKSKAGVRTISLPAGTLEALREQQARQRPSPLPLADASRAGGLVFTGATGRAIDQRNLTARFDRLVRRAGVKPISFHGLRHTHATLLLLEGVDLKTVSARLGHASIQITAHTYLRALPELDQRAAEAIGRALGGRIEAT